MICIEGNEEVLFFYELLGHLVVLVQVHGDSQHSGCLTDVTRQECVVPLCVPPGIPWLISPLVSAICVNCQSNIAIVGISEYLTDNNR